MPRLRPASLALLTLLALLAGGPLAVLAGRSATSSTRSSPAGAPRAAAGLDGAGGEAVDLEVVTRIRDEGFHRSQALATAAYLSDRIGSRLTGTPELKEANEWTRRELTDWGLANAHLEAWRFGHGWSFSRAVVAMSPMASAPAASATKAIPAAPAASAPRWTQLQALPKAWTPGTPGEVRGEAVRVTIDAAGDMDRYRGKLGGKVVLLDKARDVASFLYDAASRPALLPRKPLPASATAPAPATAPARRAPSARPAPAGPAAAPKVVPPGAPPAGSAGQPQPPHGAVRR